MDREEKKEYVGKIRGRYSAKIQRKKDARQARQI